METKNSKSDSLWYYLDEHEHVCGPLPLNEIKALVENGTLSGESRVCRAGQEQWQLLTIALLPPVPAAPKLPPLPVRSAPSGTQVQEYRRTCRTCGKVWHSLLDREAKIRKDIKDNKCAPLIHCCNPEVEAQSRRNIAAQDSELSRLQKCPECHSANYHEEILTHNVPSTE